MVKNSQIISEIFNTLFKISKRKTTEGYAYALIETTKEELQPKYPFFSSFSIKDTRFSENENFINYDTSIESIPQSTLCHGLQDFIIQINQSLGKTAGPFFYKEIYSTISNNSNDTIQTYGLDLMLMQLEYEINQLEKRIIKTLDQQK